MLPNLTCGTGTHPAEKVFVMLAGQAHWKRTGNPFALHGVGELPYHPSMMEHATRAGAQGFMSIYAWRVDLSTEQYVYAGLPNAAR